MPHQGFSASHSVPWLNLNVPFVPSTSLHLTVMPTKHVKCVQQVFLLVTTCILLLAVPAAGLCDRRCEKANPSLYRLKAIWSRVYKTDTATFDDFVQRLISASGDNQRLSPLRERLVLMIGSYRDCVMACEHAFSKRSSFQNNRLSRKYQLCNLLARGHKNTLTPIPKEIVKYCFTRVP